MAQEIMHSGLLRQDGSQDRGFADVQSIKANTFELAKINARVAVLHDYDSLWIYDQQPHNQDLSYWRQFMLFYTTLRSLGVDVDIIHPSQLAQKDYALIVSPALTLLTENTAQQLKDSAEDTPIIFGPRTGFRAESGLVANQGQFELIESLVGCKMTNFDSLRPGLTQEIANVKTKDIHYGELWSEGYQVSTAQSTHQYIGGPLDNQAAVIKNNNVTIIGALSQTLIAEVLCTALVNASVDVIIMPKGVRISRRGEKSLVTNFNQHPVSWQGKTIPAVSYLIY